MPKKLQDTLNARISAEIARHRDGIGIEGLHVALAGLVSRRTLQRRLLDLTLENHLSAAGAGKARRYRALDGADIPIEGTLAVTLEIAKPIAVGEIYVPISATSQEILAHVRLPIQQRTPIGYDRSFLESYRPNKSHYLPQEIRDHLRNIGQAPDGERLAGTYARGLLDRLLIDLAWASSKLEGNTYTRLDTQNLLEFGQIAARKDRRETQMILNHKAAIEFLVEQSADIGFDLFTFYNLHALLSENLLADPRESGRLRHRIVEVSGTVFHPLGIPQQLEHYLRMLLEKAEAIDDPFEQAFFTMVQIPYLQPFVDVNKRVSRLGANISLIRRNLCPLSFVDVPERAYIEGTLGIYELTRVELLRDVFVWAYERACQRYAAIRTTIAEPDPIRLRYREALITVTGEIVRGLKRPTKAVVRAVVASLVPKGDVNRVSELARDDLRNLHEGNITRVRLRLAEYRAWQALLHQAAR